MGQVKEIMMEYNTIYHTDALSLMADMDDDSIDMALTSPPYDNLRTYDGHSDFDFEGIAQETYRVLKPGGVLVWVVGDATIDGSETLTSMRQALYFVDVVGFKMHDTMIYYRDGTLFPDPTRYTPQWEYMFIFSIGRPKTINQLKQKNKYAGGYGGGNAIKYQREANGHAKRPRRKTKEYGVLGNVWKISSGGGKTTKDKEAYAHPAMFPEKLAERHILTWSNPGDVVMDYFMGSGTTAKMARNNGRHYIGCDVNGDYVELARKRLAKPYTPKMFQI